MIKTGTNLLSQARIQPDRGSRLSGALRADKASATDCRTRGSAQAASRHVDHGDRSVIASDAARATRYHPHALGRVADD